VRSLPEVSVTLPARWMGWFDMYQNTGDNNPNHATACRLQEGLRCVSTGTQLECVS
jgi:hypothetical protein